MLIEEILNSEEIKKIEEIEKGWSADNKFYIQLFNGEEYLLKKSSLDTFSRKVDEFDWLTLLIDAGLPISEPLDIKGVDDEVFFLFRWLKGLDALNRLAGLPKEEQYRLGVESGEILKTIHKLDVVTEGMEDWGAIFNRKVERNLKRYHECGLSYKDEKFYLNAIETYKPLIQKRPQTFQHGDFHIGNMLLTNKNELRIIDFDRWDFGDPWEEFNRIDFTAEVSGAFATGQLNAYFEGRPPQEFFELLLFYISSNTLSALPWAMGYSVKEVQTIQDKAARVRKWYKNSNSAIPSWYDVEMLSMYETT